MSTPLAWMKALRPHQYSKNLLIFTPIILAHKMGQGHLWTLAIGAFVAFCMMASAVYLLNDIMDREHDRIHPTKKNRPIASGKIAPKHALLVAFVLCSLSLAIAFHTGFQFAAMIAGYAVVTTAYTFYLKKIPILDVLTLGTLYTWRILAGGIATDVLVSGWFIGFSIFIFFSLACAKRATELKLLKGSASPSGRGYQKDDLYIITNFGVSSGYCSVIISSLYINSPKVSVMYQNPTPLWFCCMILLYWISRIWFLTARGTLDQDPVKFALSDWQSYLLLTLVLATGYLAMPR